MQEFKGEGVCRVVGEKKKKKALQQTQGNAVIPSPFPQSSGCHPAGQEGHRLTQHTTVPAWSGHCNEGIAVLPPQLAGWGIGEEKQACPRVREVLQALTYHAQMEFQKNPNPNISKPCGTKLEMWYNGKSLHKTSKKISITSIPHGQKWESGKARAWVVVWTVVIVILWALGPKVLLNCCLWLWGTGFGCLESPF